MARTAEREELDEVLSMFANTMVIVANAWDKLPRARRNGVVRALTSVVLEACEKPDNVVRLFPRKRGGRTR